MLFQDRTEAGQHLAQRLSHYASKRNLLVLGLPRGGIPVALEVAQALKAQLDVFVVRKLGVPGHEELAMGAIATGGVRFINRSLTESLGISQSIIDSVARVEQQELERRERSYRGNRPLPIVIDRPVILIDDGLATGASMRAAIMALRQKHPESITVAVPVAAERTCEEFRDQVDDIVCAATPEPFRAVGLWYRNFPQITDEEVRDLLLRAWQQELPPAAVGD
jgi:putative phosphoribosyl transferase